MIADPAHARGGVGLCALGLGALFAPGRSERVRRGREVGHCRSHRRSGGCGRHGRHGSNFLGVAARDRGRRGFSTKFEIVCVRGREGREVLRPRFWDEFDNSNLLVIGTPNLLVIGTPGPA